MGIPNFPGEKCVGRLEGGEEGGGVCQTIAICGGGEKDWRIYRGATICGTKGWNICRRVWTTSKYMMMHRLGHSLTYFFTSLEKGRFFPNFISQYKYEFLWTSFKTTFKRRRWRHVRHLRWWQPGLAFALESSTPGEILGAIAIALDLEPFYYERWCSSLDLTLKIGRW